MFIAYVAFSYTFIFAARTFLSDALLTTPEIIGARFLQSIYGIGFGTCVI